MTPVVRNPVRATVLKTNKALLDACQLWLAALLLICIPVAAFGQTAPGALQGTVTDPSGAVVINAMVARLPRMVRLFQRQPIRMACTNCTVDARQIYHHRERQGIRGVRAG